MMIENEDINDFFILKEIIFFFMVVFVLIDDLLMFSWSFIDGEYIFWSRELDEDYEILFEVDYE